ncbi:hypothetical protein BD310DRAFT_365160 [Dichomitus squalens]|uniref:Uncharacterized protein n=1 Tax=Dichomitus squalens TaxID=114155 RepID=A0A4Q9Q038_9APHY|nr:hypothetical protein BD310DRAFT_365160 [Dichomitus squalens]
MFSLLKTCLYNSLCHMLVYQDARLGCGDNMHVPEAAEIDSRRYAARSYTGYPLSPNEQQEGVWPLPGWEGTLRMPSLIFQLCYTYRLPRVSSGPRDIGGQCLTEVQVPIRTAVGCQSTHTSLVTGSMTNLSQCFEVYSGPNPEGRGRQHAASAAATHTGQCT